jgi:hypothetical protein
MFTVKLMKYDYASSLDGVPSPASTTGISVREANAVHLRIEKDGRQVLQLGDAPGDTMEVTIGSREDCAYNLAYIMNAAGKTVETVR